MENIIINAKDLESILIGAIQKQAKDVLEGWQSPIKQIVIDAVTKNEQAIKQVVYKAVETTVASENFKKALSDELNHKLANLVINKCSGLVEKSFNSIMQDPILRVKLQTEVINLIEGGKNDK